MNDRLRVLIVDDDFAVAIVHEQFVDAHDGFVVVGKAHDGASAIEAVRRLRPDVVLLDLYLPDMSGLEVLGRIRSDASAQHVEVVAVTAARDLESVRRARAGGVFHYLAKPFTSVALHDRLDNVLEHHRTMMRSDSSREIDQHTVDEIIQGGVTARAAIARLPKGLGQATLDLIVATLRDFSADASAAEVADKAGMSRVSARRYLEFLSASGRAAVTPRYGQAGRPEHRYRLITH